jgi:hypothetical protein
MTTFIEHRLTIEKEEYKLLKNSLPILQIDWGIIFSWIFIHLLGKCDNENQGYEFITRSWIDEWGLTRIIEWLLKEIAGSDHNTNEGVYLVKLLTTHQNWITELVSGTMTSDQTIRTIISDPEVQSFIQINRFKNVLWFNKENFDKLIKNLSIIGLIIIRSRNKLDTRKLYEEFILLFKTADKWIKAAEKAKYQVDEFFNVIQE